MNAEVLAIVRDGLNYSNLAHLVEFCRTSFDQHPTIYGTLLNGLVPLTHEYEDQGIPIGRYNEIMTILQQPLIAVLEGRIL